MSIDLTYKLIGLAIVIAGWIWHASKISSNFKSLEKEFDEYKESQKEAFSEYKKLIEKQVSDNQEEIEKFGKDLHRYNKNTQKVINDMRTDEIVPATMNIEALFKSDEATKKDISEIKGLFDKIFGKLNDLKIQIALQTQSKN